VEPDADLAAFCRVEWPRLVGALSLYTGEPAVAEDLAQEALVRAWQRWPKVREMDSPSGWVHRVAFNLAASHHRRRRAFQRLRPRLVALPSNAPDLADALAVRDAVRDLPDDQRRALIMRYFADFTVVETAKALGCPVNTVKTRTRRALAALRERDLIDDDPVATAAGGATS
jgi:RNA polymerase sigma-70 factor (ECF subfamily)